MSSCEIAGFEASRIAAALEALVVVGHEPADGVREPAELAEKPASQLGMTLDEREFLVGQRPRLLQDLIGYRELADVVQKSADREIAKPVGLEPELLADLHGAKGDTPRVLLSGAVLLRQAHGQRTHAWAEERLLLEDEVGCAEVARERT